MADAPIPTACPQCGNRLVRIFWDRARLSAEDVDELNAGRAIQALSDRPDRDRMGRRALPAWACRRCVPDWDVAYRFAVEDTVRQFEKASAVNRHDFETAARLRDQQILARPEWSALTGRLLRCLAPGLQTHLGFDRRWRTTDVVGLARAIDEDRAFDRLPILADALMDAGCADPGILNHCRDGGRHVRGCWVVELALGRA